MSRCPEGGYLGKHSPLDAYGRCNWCGRKVERTMPMPTILPVSELTEAYKQFYDPDWGGHNE